MTKPVNNKWADEFVDSIDADWWHDGQVHYKSAIYSPIEPQRF